MTLASAGLLFAGQNLPAGHAFYERSLSIARAMNDAHSICQALIGLDFVAAEEGDTRLSRACCEECLAVSRAAGDQWGLNQALNNLGGLALEEGDYATARAMFEESLQGRRALGNKSSIAQSLNNLGNVAYFEGDYTGARAYLQESVALALQVGNWPAVAMGLGVLAGVETQQASRAAPQPSGSPAIPGEDSPTSGDDTRQTGFPAQAQRAARLLGAALEWVETHHGGQGGFERVERGIVEQATTTLRALLGEEAFARACQEGRALRLEQAVAEAGAENPAERGG